MSEIIEKTYKLLDALDNSEVIKKLTYYKSRLTQDEAVLSLVKKIKEENNPEIKIELRKKLYNNDDYKNYMEAYNELSFIVLKINKQYAKYTNTKGCTCHG